MSVSGFVRFCGEREFEELFVAKDGQADGGVVLEPLDEAGGLAAGVGHLRIDHDDEIIGAQAGGGGG